jgi:FAD/FMN-containing dehydrogenase
MSRPQILQQLQRLDALDELALLAEAHPLDYQAVLEEEGLLDLIPDDSEDEASGAVERDLERMGLGLLAISADVIAGCRHARQVIRRTTKVVGTARAPDSEVPGVWFPHSRESLAALLGAAASKDCRVTCAGSWRSFSDVNRPAEQPRGTDILFATSFMNQAATPSGSGLYACQAGRTVKQIIRDLHGRDHALFNMGGGDFQTIGGAVLTGTHGSGRELGDLASFLTKAEICTLDAQKQPKFVTIEGRDLAPASVSLGSMGVLYGAEFRVRDHYRLLERRLLMPWSEAAAVVSNHLAGGDTWRHLEVLVIPYLLPLDSLWRQLRRRNTRPYDSAREVPDQDFLAVVTLRREARDHEPNAGTRPFVLRAASGPMGRWLAYRGLDSILRRPRKLPRTLKRTMAMQRVDEYVAHWDDVLRLGLKVDASGSEFSVPAEQSLRAAELILQAAQERLERGIPEGMDELMTFWRERPMHTSPFAMRFVKAGDAWLSMAEGRDSCMLEMPMLQNPKREAQDSRWGELHRAYREGRQRLVDEIFDRLSFEIPFVRPHWGLSTPTQATGEDWARQRYAKWDEWVALYRQFNRHGTFDSAFTDRVGISIRPR